MMVPTELKTSQIDGVGVFALRFIPKGELIWRLDDRFYVLISGDDLNALPPLMQEHFAKYSWPHMIKKGYYCCDIDNGRFMNHSNEPNTDFRHAVDAWAIRDIDVGEEITCDYRQFDPRFAGF